MNIGSIVCSCVSIQKGPILKVIVVDFLNLLNRKSYRHSLFFFLCVRPHIHICNLRGFTLKYNMFKSNYCPINHQLCCIFGQIPFNYKQQRVLLAYPVTEVSHLHRAVEQELCEVTTTAY